MTENATTTPDEWALIEIMGHRRSAGRIQEVERFGATLLRVDMPVGEPADGAFVTEYFGGSAIYALRPCTEDVARAAASRLGDPRPVQPLAYRLAEPEPEAPPYRQEHDHFDDDDERPF